MSTLYLYDNSLARRLHHKGAVVENNAADHSCMRLPLSASISATNNTYGRKSSSTVSPVCICTILSIECVQSSMYDSIKFFMCLRRSRLGPRRDGIDRAPFKLHRKKLKQKT